MTESEQTGARSRVEAVDRRLAALQDLGIDVAALRTQLGQARSHVDQGRGDEAQALCDEVAEAARRMAAGAARSSGEWRGLPKAQLLEELRRALGDGAVTELMTEREHVLRDEFETRQRDFERRLRDQFARELAQVISARPWLKDMPSTEPDSEAEISRVRSETAALRAISSVTASQTREPVAKIEQPSLGELNKNGEPKKNLEPSVVPALQHEIEVVRNELMAAPSMVRLNALVAKIIESQGTTAPADSTKEDLSNLIADSASLHSWLAEQLLRLESRLVAVISPHLTFQPATSSISRAVPAVGTGPQVNKETIWPFPSEEGEHPPLAGTSKIRAESAKTTPLTAKMPAKIDNPGDQSRDGSVPSSAQPAQGALTAAISSPAGIFPALSQTSAVEEVVKRLIDERMAGLRGHNGDELLPDDEEYGRQLIRLLPEVLQDPVVRSALFAGFALEATAHPGALAELSGLRAFLRKELHLAIDGLRREMSETVG